MNPPSMLGRGSVNLMLQSNRLFRPLLSSSGVLGRALLCCALAAASAIAGAERLSPAAKSYLARGQAALAANPALEYVPGSLLVKFRPGVDERAKFNARSALGATLIRRFDLVPGLEHIGVPTEVEFAAALLAANPNVDYAEPDYVVHADLMPNDPSFGTLWGMHNTGQSGGAVDADIDAPEAWDTTNGSPSFVIAVIDTGIDYNHPDLAANCWVNPGEIAGNGIDDDGNGFVDDVRGWDFYNNDNNPIDDNNHGTHCSGTIGGVGNNGIGVTGVNWNCKLMALKFLGASGSGSTTGAISCLNYAVAEGVRVSNNSWGGGGYSASLYSAIEAAKSVNHVFCAAAGNSGLNNDSSPHYPSSYTNDNLIAVASIDRYGARSSFSNWGATSVDLGAPGTAIYSTVRNGAYSNFNGTSMATPHVAGVVGLVTAQNPGWTYSQVRSRVLSTVAVTSAMSGITVTGGVVNAANAVAGAPVNTAPSVTIGSPANGSTFAQGATVLFSGSASDAQEGNLSASLIWTSSLMGTIGSGASFSRNDLSVGTHTITASCTDGGNLTGTASITLTIQAATAIPNAPSGIAAIRLSDNVARITYVDNSGNETGFEIERQVRTGNSWGGSVTISVAANVTQVDDPAGDGRFRYRVRAVNGSGASEWSAWANVRL